MQHVYVFCAFCRRFFYNTLITKLHVVTLACHDSDDTNTDHLIILTLEYYHGHVYSVYFLATTIDVALLMQVPGPGDYGAEQGAVSGGEVHLQADGHRKEDEALQRVMTSAWPPQTSRNRVLSPHIRSAKNSP